MVLLNEASESREYYGMKKNAFRGVVVILPSVFASFCIDGLEWTLRVLKQEGIILVVQNIFSP